MQGPLWWPENQFLLSVNCDINLGNMTWSQSHAIVLNIIQIKHDNKELWVRRRFWLCVYFDFDFGDMTLGPGHETPFSYQQQFCEILSRVNMAVRSYGPDMDFGYMWSVTWLWRYDLGSRGHDKPLGHGQQLCEI